VTARLIARPVGVTESVRERVGGSADGGLIAHLGAGKPAEGAGVVTADERGLAGVIDLGAAGFEHQHAQPGLRQLLGGPTAARGAVGAEARTLRELA